MKALLLLMMLTFSVPAGAFDLGGLIGGNSEQGDNIRRATQLFNLAKALIPISDKQEITLGRAVAIKVITRYGVEKHPQQTYYLNLVATIIAQRSDRPNIPYRVAILATDDVNAYACPGGYIFVTRGALNMVRDEAELAAILAHEISHITERHIIKALQQSKLMKVGADVAASEFRTGGALFEKMADFATDSLFKGLKKSDEYASDSKAIEYLDRLGYDYPAMSDVLTLLHERKKAGAAKVLAKTHPSATSRLRKLKSTIKKLSLEEPTGIRLRNRFVRYHKKDKKTSS